MKKQLLIAALAVLSIAGSMQALLQPEGEPTIGQRLGITNPNVERGSIWGDRGYGYRGSWRSRHGYRYDRPYRGSWGSRHGYYGSRHRYNRPVNLNEPVEVRIGE